VRRTITVFIAVLAAGCRVVNDNVPVESAAPLLLPSPFLHVDSLLQNGKQDCAVRILREMDPAVYGTADVLWRFVGAYNSRGMANRCVCVLDSLQRAGWGDLTGWKISVLDLNHELQQAVELVPSRDALLLGWLYRDSLEEMPPVLSLPVPSHLGERAARLLLAPEGITRGQLELAASDVKYLPVTVGTRVELELELAVASSGTWWSDALKAFDPEGTSDPGLRLQALRMKYHGLGDYSYWHGLLGSSAEVTAAGVIASRWPDMVSWKVADVLIDCGYGQIAAAIANSRGDLSFSTGVRMAELKKAGSYPVLEALCDSIPADASVDLRARAALFRARSLRARRQNTAAFRAYYRFAEEFPFHPTAREASYLAGKYFDSEQNWAEAADAYLASLRASGNWDGDSRAHWRGGFCLYMNGRGAVGDSLWQAGCERFHCSHWVDEMLFWRARYAGKQGNESRRIELLRLVAREHPWEFYGMLAAQRLGIQDELHFTVASPVINGNRVLSMAAELFSRGYGTAGVEMLFAGREGDRGQNAVALGILGEHGKSIAAMRRMDTEYRNFGTGILPDSLLGWYFPVPYMELVNTVTDTMALDASYVEGIMREESYFNRFVISSAGAAGLIQLMPGTAGDVARWNGLPTLSSEEFFNPGNSVLYGSLYINSQVRRYSHPALFLAAYNAGPGNASRWIDMHGFSGSDQELFIEQITYRETRMYAKKVQRSAWIYGRTR
jgi:hypothetical protein